MSQVETLPDVFPEAEHRTVEQRAISSYHTDLRYCIDFGGAISAEDALDSYMRQLFGNFVPATAIENVRHKITNLDQDIQSTDPERYKTQRLEAYTELFIFGATIDRMPSGSRKDLISETTIQLYKLVADGDYISVRTRPQFFKYRELLHSYVTEINKEWLIPLLNKQFPFEKSEEDAETERSQTPQLYHNDEERFTPTQVQLPFGQALKRILPRLRGH